jgi:hypothetical protein
MITDIAYSANRDDLYSPCKNAQFFAAGPPRSDAALCVELARLVYCRNASTFAFDRERIGAVLNSVGFTHCEFFEAGGTHCFLAKRPKELAVLAIRGTDADDPTDLGNDADIVLTPWERGGRVHHGFATALNMVRPDVENALRCIEDRVLFTGHSLGAAMVTLLASARKPDFLYTFGSPKVGDSDFVDTLNAVPNCRYVDCCDLVARMPPDILGYAHLRNADYIYADRHVTFNPDAEVVEADQAHAREKYLVEYAWRHGNIVLRDLADHAPINYVLPVSADQS